MSLESTAVLLHGGFQSPDNWILFMTSHVIVRGYITLGLEARKHNVNLFPICWNSVHLIGEQCLICFNLLVKMSQGTSKFIAWPQNRGTDARRKLS